MLIVTRRVREQIVIGDNIAITVCRICDGTVRLGIEAAKEIPVHRREIQDRINRQAAKEQRDG